MIQSNATTAGLNWFNGDHSQLEKYNSLDVEQLRSVAIGILGNGPIRCYAGISKRIQAKWEKLGSAIIFPINLRPIFENAGLKLHKNEKQFRISPEDKFNFIRCHEPGSSGWDIGFEVWRNNHKYGVSNSPEDAIKQFKQYILQDTPKQGNPQSIAQDLLKTLSNNPTDNIITLAIIKAYKQRFGTFYNYPHRDAAALPIIRLITGRAWEYTQFNGKTYDAVDSIGQPSSQPREQITIAEFKGGLQKNDFRFGFDKQNDEKRRIETLDYDLYCFMPLDEDYEQPISFIMIPKGPHIINTLKSKQDDKIIDIEKRKSEKRRDSNHDDIGITLREILYHFGDSEMSIYITSDAWQSYTKICKQEFIAQMKSIGYQC